MYAMLSIDDACYTCYLSMMHSHAIYDDACYMLSMMHAILIDRWSILMLLIDDTCYTCYRSMMSAYAIDLRCMFYGIDRWCIIYDDACYTCYRSMMHATCYRSLMMHAYAIDLRCTLHAIDRSMMHSIHDIYDDAYYSCLWWCMLHVIDLWWSILHMLSIYDDASHRSTVHATHAIDR
jgi:hypothetical protein